MNKDTSKINEDKPFTAPSQWYPYVCCACNFREWTEDIFIDAFLSDGPGNCPIMCCPECGEDFVLDVNKQSIKSEQDPNCNN